MNSTLPISAAFSEALTETVEAADWRAYDAAAMELARKGLKGDYGDPLPLNMSASSVKLINDDPEAFQYRVRMSAYALAMGRND